MIELKPTKIAYIFLILIFFTLGITLLLTIGSWDEFTLYSIIGGFLLILILALTIAYTRRIMTRIIFENEIIVIKSMFSRNHIPMKEVSGIMLKWNPTKGPAILDLEFTMKSSRVTKQKIFETSFSNPLDAVEKISEVFGPVNRQNRKGFSRVYHWEIN